ncbi:alpha/beta hydrolase [Paenibacillus sp. TRM 82003]|uniref:alpha/beta fold hydrolase n=1 Tax=Kineococcus sp. TRM81007 TaxID=2925831 RepID=UPI001F5606A7|nr:alpha/beta hydrolase [Kineococcus sp. TRM81007]MCI2238298.1 alpha/beta hydrolase [Kineococcus sp. TRM81007]MCI3924030.1 alpha/beta hydrolase [Paenibacillus sp. TRM 82003]
MTSDAVVGSFPSPADGLPLTTYRWADVPGEPLGVVQVAHGLAEHGRRYARLAAALNAAGFVVAADDHRGHGSSTGPGVPLGGFGEVGFAGFTADIARYGELLRDEHGGLPVFLLAHSLGSMGAQNVLLERSDLYDGVVLSGSTALDGLVDVVRSLPADQPGLAAFNAPFEDRTGFEWLSRDPAEVDAYVADPLCGFATDEAILAGALATAAATADPARLAGVRADLPVLVVSGTEDPVGGTGGDLLVRLVERYRAAGLRNVTLELLPGARHEVFNETNREEVTALVVAWLRERARAAR